MSESARVHMDVFCISMEEYAQHREGCRLPSRTDFLSAMLLLSLLLPHLSKAQPCEVYHQGLPLFKSDSLVVYLVIVYFFPHNL